MTKKELKIKIDNKVYVEYNFDDSGSCSLDVVKQEPNRGLIKWGII